ncbi:MAG: tetraacyldisaccharide 4'-kinase [Nitrospirae bacterium]|nr:tetraacyldisaccharide 4'-kinase [Nitrospirota bacterium]
MNPLEILYYAGYLFKKRLSFAYRKRLPGPVISIGNVTVGGTGKTPAVIAIAEESLKRGFSPVILTRGYRGSAKGPCLVSASKTPPVGFKGEPSKIIYTSADAGDEPVLMAGRLKGVPVIKSANRNEGGIFAIQSLAPREGAPFLFILDDGFQHWVLHRDADIVLIDGLNPFGNRKLLPMGILREPLGELKRADIFVITKCGRDGGTEKSGSFRNENEELASELRNAFPEKPVYLSGYDVVRAVNKAGSEYAPEALQDKRVFAFCGIAHPESFRRTLSSLSIRPAGFKAYRDHHFYTPSDVNYLETQAKELQCEFMLTTEKDMIKLKELEIGDNVLSLAIRWNTDAAFYDDVFGRISKK